MEIVEVNGVKYQRIPKEEKQQSRLTSQWMMMAMALGGLPGMYGMGGNRSSSGPDVDIVNEYTLIRQKKSNLSRKERDWVVYTFEKNFKKVE